MKEKYWKVRVLLTFDTAQCKKTLEQQRNDLSRLLYQDLSFGMIHLIPNHVRKNPDAVTELLDGYADGTIDHEGMKLLNLIEQAIG